MNDVREAFEKWYLSEIDGDPEELAVEEDGEHFFHAPRSAWRAWQAALQSVEGATETAIKSSPTYRALYAEKQHLIGLLAAKADAAPSGAAKSEAEIKAEGLEEFGRECGLYDPEYGDQEYIEIPRWKIKEYAASLRQTDGDD